MKLIEQIRPSLQSYTYVCLRYSLGLYISPLHTVNIALTSHIRFNSVGNIGKENPMVYCINQPGV
jgi:hypothetical protein